MKQDRINTQVDGYNALCHMILCHDPLSQKDFALCNLRGDILEAALKWCVTNDFAQLSRGLYSITSIGLAYCEDAKGNPRLTVPDYEWKEEATTGMDAKGKQTKIDRAVVPKGSSYSVRETDPEAIMMQAQQHLMEEVAAAESLDLDLEEYRDLKSLNLIRQCKGGGEAHMGRFHRGSTMCVNCRKERRK